MMNEDRSQTNRKRPWIQFHLSTLLVFMFMTGGLLWANLIARVEWWADGGRSGQSITEFYGFPFDAVQRTYFRNPDTDKFEIEPEASWINGIIALIDFFVAMLILNSVAAGCEWRIRLRRKIAFSSETS